MVSELLAGHSVVTIEGEEVEDEVLELFAEAGAVNLLEVGVSLSLEEQVVEVFFLACLFEGEDALDDDEENDTATEVQTNFESSQNFAMIVKFTISYHPRLY